MYRVCDRRICFLETVAAVPGMVAAMTRHLHSLRRLRRDYGWIHTLLGKAHILGKFYAYFSMLRKIFLCSIGNK